jgi:hypothetical protein
VLALHLPDYAASALLEEAALWTKWRELFVDKLEPSYEYFRVQGNRDLGSVDVELVMRGRETLARMSSEIRVRLLALLEEADAWRTMLQRIVDGLG